MKKVIIFLVLLLPLFAATTNAPPIPVVDLTLNAPQTPTQLVKSLNIMILLTILVLAPSIVLVMTSFVRLLVVFSFLRQALGTQQLPPSQLLVSLALVLTFFIMEPYAKVAYKNGIEPYMNNQIGYEEAFTKSVKPFKQFMIKNTREKDLALFYRIRHMQNPKTIDDVPLSILVPAFMISELKTAFEIGFLIYLPFLIIDMVVSAILMSLGMMMLPPVMISLPFKLLIFVLVDGWNLLVQSLVASFK
jgi:flagellar biosynthetic protein FliP